MFSTIVNNNVIDMRGNSRYDDRQVYDATIKPKNAMMREEESVRESYYAEVACANAMAVVCK